MAKSEGKRVQLDPERKKKMDTLSREIHTRIEEMAQIMADSVGITLNSGMSLKFAPKRTDGTAERGLRQIEIICAPDGVCGCYDSEPGICVYPC
jgi:hypothetical protein